MTKYYFDIDKISVVKLTMERESDYKWKEAVPARPKTFLGIKYGMHPEIPAGWSEYDQELECELRHRVQSSYFTRYEWYRADETAKKVFVKPHVEVRLGSKESISQRFNSNEEAQAYVINLMSQTTKKFDCVVID